MKKTTFKSVQANLRTNGVSIRKTEHGEYRVAFKGAGNEDSAYYTSDLEDALSTGMLMRKKHPESDVKMNPQACVPLITNVIVELDFIPDVSNTIPVYNGECQFYINYWLVSENIVYSAVFNNPTWKDILTACDKILIDSDRSIAYLEGIKFSHVADGIKVYEFLMGS